MGWSSYFDIFRLIGLRYLVLASLAFLFFYLPGPGAGHFSKIQKKFPRLRDYAREIGYSALTIGIFAAVLLLMLRQPRIAAHTTLYHSIAQYGWAYYFLIYPVLFFMHDTYFYWTHRFMHLRPFFRIMHLAHHRSTNPSPWAAYAFHPLEAVVEIGIVVVFLETLPVHPSHLIVFSLVMITYNVYGHLGFELYPKTFCRSRLGKWINTSVAHNQHHQYFAGNYGLYFLFWDRLMGTVRKDYNQTFQSTAGAPPA